VSLLPGAGGTARDLRTKGPPAPRSTPGEYSPIAQSVGRTSGERVVARYGVFLQSAGLTMAALAYFLIWLFRPHRGPIPGVWAGPLSPSHWVLVLAAALAVAALASIRWRWAGIALVPVAIASAWYAITNHAVQTTHVPGFGIPYEPVIVIGAVMTIAGLGIRVLATTPQPEAQV
jgi:hypothetical protein